MKRQLRLILCGAALLSTASPSARGQLSVLETENLRLISLDRAHSYLLPHVVRCFENSLRFHRRLFDYSPSEEVTTLLHDWNDYGSGGTNTIPWNYLSIGIEPYDYVYETSPTNERFNWVMNHELVHVLATDKAAGSDRFFRSVFQGKVSPIAENPLSMFYSYLTSPRWYCPRWYHEGIATFMETWMAGGIGRALGGYDEMVFRAMVKDSAYFYDYVGLESEGTTIDFQIGANSYLYGTRFMSYLAYRYGPEQLLRWVNRTDDSDRYFATQFQRVYGGSLPDEWGNWIRWEHDWQRANLDSVRRYPLTEYRPVIPAALGSVSRAFFDSSMGRVFVAVNLPGQVASIVSLDVKTGAMERLCDVLSPALYYVCSTAYDPATRTLYYTTHNNSSWRDIHAVDVGTGEGRPVLQDVRVGDLAFNRADQSLWGVQHHNGFSTLVRIPPPYTEWQTVLPLKYGKDLFDIDISPDGRFVTASLIEISGRQQLIRMAINDLLEGITTHEVLYEFKDNSPMNFAFSPDGRSLVGTTYYTGVSNVVRYDFQKASMEWLSNVETGLFRPLPLSPDSLLAFRYTGTGFLPVMLPTSPREDVSVISYLGQQVVDRYPIVEEWKLPPPSVVNVDSVTHSAGDYDGWEEVRLASVYPIVEGYKAYTGIGARANLQEYLSLYTATLSGSYTPAAHVPAGEQVHLAAEVGIWNVKLRGAYNGADFYDLFGPTKRSRKGYALSGTYSDYLVYERPTTLSYTVGVSAYWGLERLPYAQNVAVTYDNFFTLTGELEYQRQLRSLGAVDFEKGVRLSVANYTYIVRSVWFPLVYGMADLGLALPWDHSSLWFRGAAGYSPRDEQEPFANFYFGGFGNNWVDYREVRRYRDALSFPGVALNEIGGTVFLKGMVEWTLPPLRFRRFGIPSLYCTWSRLAFFTGAILANPHLPSVRRVVSHAGGQIDFKLVFFSNLSSTFSLGYALAWEADQRTSGEFMISLKIL